MSYAGDWNSFASGLGAGQSTAGESSEWSLLFARRGRPLAVPTGIVADPASLDFFVHNPRKWWWAQFSMLGQYFTPLRLPRVALTAAQQVELRSILDGSDASKAATSTILAIQFGSRGPLQKVMVLGRTNDGTQYAIKLALRASADERIAAEIAAIRSAATLPFLATHLPDITASGVTSAGRPYFVMRAPACEPTSAKFGSEHAQLLRQIGTASLRFGAWRESALYGIVESRLASITSSDTDELLSLQKAWIIVCAQLSDRRMPLCLSHGDFAAWNILRTEDGLLAVDWEYAQRDGNPLGDYFHFHLIPTALDGSLRARRFDIAFVLAGATRHAMDIFKLPEDEAKTLVRPLLAAYLIDTITFYALASGGIKRQDPVVDSYLHCMAEMI